jgi:hypothetical protein
MFLQPAKNFGLLYINCPFFTIVCRLIPSLELPASRKSFSASYSHHHLSHPIFLVAYGLLSKISSTTFV